ncbi:AaceriADR065Wp [[Ashbya] aceris (nom. inval.)]|nr:AaceriADR065Wp [[Ashbya] aceris (nom. inval.)]
MMPFAIRHPVTALEDDTGTQSRRRRSSSVKQALSSFFTGDHGSEEVAEMDRSGPQGRRASTPGLEGTTRRVARRFSSPARGDSRSEHRARSALGDEGPRWPMDHGIEDMFDEGTLFGIDDVGAGSSADVAGCGGLDSREFLTEYLAERGFVQQRTLLSKGDVSVYALTSGEIVFLPTASSLEEGYLRNIRRSMENDDAFSEDYGDSRTMYDDPETAIPDSYSATSLESDESESAMPVTQLTTELLDDTTTLFNLAVVVSVAKPVEMSEIKARLFSRVRVHWHNGLPPGRRKFEEYYTIGDLKWTLTAENYNLYVPMHVSTDDQIIERSTGVIHRKLFKNIYERNESTDRVTSNISSFVHTLSDHTYTFKPGEYVFILPVQFIRQVPETIYVPSARLNYDFCCGMRVNKPNVPESETAEQHVAEKSSCCSKAQKDTDTSHKLAERLLKKVKARLTPSNQPSAGHDANADTVACGSMPVTVVRTPPLRSISIADKPIYINRVWTNALSYEISLLQKYVPLDSEIPLKIKLVPLMKHVSVKRLRINITEKITLASKDLKYEFDQMDVIMQDPYNPLFPELQFLKKPARSLPLLEVRTKEKGIKALREEVIENAMGDNLLCYTDNILNNEKGVEMVDSLTIETTLKFPKFTVPRKNGTMPPYGIEELVPSPDSPHAQRQQPSHGVLGLFGRRSSAGHLRTEGSSPSTTAGSSAEHSATTLRTGSRVPIEHSTFINLPKRGLYADSTHFKHIVVKHKLEVMLRVSKRDSDLEGAKLRHYEVLIDTPIVLLSEYCSRQNVDLPTYNMVTGDSRFRSSLPTFEEAVSETLSAPDSPVTSPIASPDILASYDPDEFSIQQLSLSRTTTHTQGDPHVPSDFSPLRRYSNIDEMMRSSSSNTGSAESARCPAYSADPPTYEDT